jgi:uncharacterized protein (DUF362 family)/NAD-dependent dihydropyrimidine dehydrogenase PreA subunit
MSKVMIHPASYENPAEAIRRAFEIFPLNLKGKKILIKPNVLRTSQANEAIVTHPAVLAAVVRMVESMDPASIIVGDNPGVFSYGANEESFKKSGLMDAAGGYYRNIGTDARTMDFNPDYMPAVSVSRAVLEADILISLPKFKTHGLTVMTGAIKNSFGILPGAQKARLHKAAGTPERFHDMIVDVFRIRIPDLFIVDAVIGMEGNGPASPELRDIGLILASDNAVAMDATIATMMGCDPAKLGFLRKARKVGLGDFDPNTIEIIGELNPIPDFKLPPLGGEATTGNPAIQAVLARPTTLQPRANPESCTGCGACIDQCPVGALSMVGPFPEANPEICIRCFCCQEICPEKAMTLV